MKKTLIAGAMAGKPPKPEPTPDLTPRVEALEQDVYDLSAKIETLDGNVESLITSSQEQSGRLQQVEDTLATIQPGYGQPMVVDANGSIVGALLYAIHPTVVDGTSAGADSRLYIATKFEEYGDEAYFLSVNHKQ